MTLVTVIRITELRTSVNLELGRRIIMLSVTLRAYIKPVLVAAFLLLFVPALRAQNDSVALFQSNCTMCHSADGSGSGPTGKALKVPDLRSEAVQKLTDAQLTDAIAKGKRPMPAFKDQLTADQIVGLVSYVRGLTNLAKK